MFNWLRRLKPQSKPRNPASPDERVMDLGDDPLDPHGDGTIRKGDPMMYYPTMNEGRATIGNRRPDGNWDVKIIPDDDSTR